MGGPRYQYIVIITTAYCDRNISDSCKLILYYLYHVFHIILQRFYKSPRRAVRRT